jgi:hypothetical protein
MLDAAYMHSFDLNRNLFNHNLQAASTIVDSTSFGSPLKRGCLDVVYAWHRNAWARESRGELRNGKTTGLWFGGGEFPQVFERLH